MTYVSNGNQVVNDAGTTKNVGGGAPGTNETATVQRTVPVGADFTVNSGQAPATDAGRTDMKFWRGDTTT